MNKKLKKISIKSGENRVPAWMIAVSVVLALLILVIVALVNYDGDEPAPDSTDSSAESQETSAEAVVSPMQEVDFDLGDGLVITDIGSYSGMYMEDGSDDIVSGVMMIIVTNQSEDTLQYAQITLKGESVEAQFSLSTLEPGASVVVLEANRLEYSDEDDFTEASAKNVVFFKESPNKYTDVFKIQTLDGGFNITNISNENITGKIVIYYKYVSDSLYYGGITFRGTIEGGLAAGEIRQIMSQHFSASGTEIMYITVTEE